MPRAAMGFGCWILRRRLDLRARREGHCIRADTAHSPAFAHRPAAAPGAPRSRRRAVTSSTLAWVSAMVLIASFIQGSTGVGFALLVAPLLGILAPTMLPVAVLVLMLPLNFYVAFRERAALDFRSGGWITLGRIAGTFGGLWVLTVLS